MNVLTGPASCRRCQRAAVVTAPHMLLRVHFTDYDTRIAAYAVVVDDRGRLLLAWYNGTRHGSACWSMPGGGVEFEESLQDGLVREVREETGYLVEVGRPLAVNQFTVNGEERRGRPYKCMRVLFDATITGGELGTLEIGGSTDFAEWVPLSRVPSLTPVADIVELALDELAKAGRTRG